MRNPVKSAKRKIRISAAYAYVLRRYGYPPKTSDLARALDDIAQMGFRHTEFEGLGPTWNRHFFKNRGFYQKRLADLGLNIHNYCIVDPKLVSLDRAVRRKSYWMYDMGCENAAAFGAVTVHVATHAPPLRYERTPYRMHKPYHFDLDYRGRVPGDFQWKTVWATVVESCRQAAETADKFGLDVLVEPRVGDVVANTDAMLTLLREVDHPRLRANFDFAHLAAQKEQLALSWMKLKDHVGGIHVADNNTRDVEHLQIGDGAVDWRTLLTLIAQSDYDRYLGIDLFTSASKARLAFVEAKGRLEQMVRRFRLTSRIEVDAA